MIPITEMGQLIDCTEEEFREFCKDKDLGFVQSLHNLMVQTYNEVQKLKDDLVAFMGKKSKAERTEEEKSTLEGLYSKLLKIELKVFILRDIIKTNSI